MASAASAVAQERSRKDSEVPIQLAGGKSGLPVAGWVGEVDQALMREYRFIGESQVPQHGLAHPSL